MKPRALLFLAIACGTPGAVSVRADDATLPGDGYSASRYEDLWKKSPFAVATAEAAPDSPDFMLVGIASVDGVSYASVIDKKTQEHFIVASDRPSDGLSLTSITPGHDGIETFAVMQKDGQPITLKLESVAAGAPGVPGGAAAPVNSMPMPGSVPPAINIPMPGTASNFPGRPLIPRYRRPPIHLPPPPTPSSQPAPAAPPPNPP